MQHLSERHQQLLDEAVSLLGPSTRPRFMMHVRAALADERDLTTGVLIKVLMRVLARFSVSVGPQYFSPGGSTRQHQQTVRERIDNNARAVEKAAT
jgi:hypothetical protein